MTSHDAQRSDIHESTEDSLAVPNHELKQEQSDLKAEPLELPDPADEREKLFPPGAKPIRDESDVGGPIEIRMDT